MSCPSRTACSLAAVLLLVVASTGHTLADDDDEIGHEAARRLVESGRILALETILATVSARVPGTLIETELEYDDGRIIYDIKILRPEGRVQEVEVDAATGEINKIEDDD
jgi:uncharacterized membrane protein YkoI